MKLFNRFVREDAAVRHEAEIVSAGSIGLILVIVLAATFVPVGLVHLGMLWAADFNPTPAVLKAHLPS